MWKIKRIIVLVITIVGCSYFFNCTKIPQQDILQFFWPYKEYKTFVYNAYDKNNSLNYIYVNHVNSVTEVKNSILFVIGQNITIVSNTTAGKIEQKKNFTNTTLYKADLKDNAIYFGYPQKVIFIRGPVVVGTKWPCQAQTFGSSKTKKEEFPGKITKINEVQLFGRLRKCFTYSCKVTLKDFQPVIINNKFCEGLGLVEIDNGVSVIKLVSMYKR